MRNRSREELEAILQSFPDVFEAQMGVKLTVEKLKTILINKLEEQERFLLQQRFIDFTPQSIRAMLQMVEEYNVKHEEQEPSVENKKGKQKKESKCNGKT